MWLRAARSQRCARCNASRRRKRRARKTWAHGARPGNVTLLSQSRERNLSVFGHAARASVDIAARRNQAGRIIASREPEQNARSTRRGMARGEIKMFRAATHRDAPSNRRATADGRATRRCRRRLGATVCDLVAHATIFGHRGVARAASSQAARPE